MAQQRGRLRRAEGETRNRLGLGQQRAAPRRAGRDHMHGSRRKGAAVAQGALLGDELHRQPAGGERMRKRLGRKKMAAGAAGGEENRRIDHTEAFITRRRARPSRRARSARGTAAAYA